MYGIWSRVAVHKVDDPPVISSTDLPPFSYVVWVRSRRTSVGHKLLEGPLGARCSVGPVILELIAR